MRGKRFQRAKGEAAQACCLTTVLAVWRRCAGALHSPAANLNTAAPRMAWMPNLGSPNIACPAHEVLGLKLHCVVAAEQYQNDEMELMDEPFLDAKVRTPRISWSHVCRAPRLSYLRTILAADVVIGSGNNSGCRIPRKHYAPCECSRRRWRQRQQHAAAAAAQRRGAARMMGCGCPRSTWRRVSPFKAGGFCLFKVPQEPWR